MDSQMKKGILEMCLLFTLSQEESYGYLLIRRMLEAFPDLPERTVYTILRRLLENGYTSVSLKSSPEGPQRKYYHITQSGRDTLQESLRDWTQLCAAIKLMGIGDGLPSDGPT